jgi:hypothetical protein
MRFITIAVLFAISLPPKSGADTKHFSAQQVDDRACGAPSRLTDDDARILLYVAPAAVDARRGGTDVDIEKSDSSRQFPVSDYFVAAIVTQKPTSSSSLGNGILGYFAVDKRSGLAESISNFTPINGMELSRVQNWMRHAHGIPVQSSYVTHSDGGGTPLIPTTESKLPSVLEAQPKREF